MLGVNVVGIGQVFYDSQIYAACLAVPGVVAVHSLDFAVTTSYLPPIYTRFRAPICTAPGQYAISAQRRSRRLVSAAPSTCCGQRHDPGADSYLFLPDDAQNLTISLEAAS